MADINSIILDKFVLVETSASNFLDDYWFLKVRITAAFGLNTETSCICMYAITLSWYLILNWSVDSFFLTFNFSYADDMEDHAKEIEHSSLQEKLDRELNVLDEKLEQKEVKLAGSGFH